ncbi:MAG: DUF4902 domain-containing protein [Pseudomonadota bacterium]
MAKLFIVSTDGYVRLPTAQLQSVQLEHLISGLDEDRPAMSPDGAVPTSITGYTEWLGKDTAAVITIGWDWQMDPIAGEMKLTMLFEPRSNIMLQDASDSDIGDEATAKQLAQWIDTLAWQADVACHIEARYAIGQAPAA